MSTPSSSVESSNMVSAKPAFRSTFRPRRTTSARRKRLPHLVLDERRVGLRSRRVPELSQELTRWSHATDHAQSAAASLAQTSVKGAPNLLLKLLNQKMEDLRVMVKNFADRSMNLDMPGARSRSAEEWAAEFLHLARRETDPVKYMEQAQRSVYARHSKTSRLLVLTAAALAWRLHENDPAYAVQGSLRSALKNKYSPQARSAFLSNTASYQAHSYAVEKHPLPQALLQEHLEQILMHPAAR